jgi:uncharacterized cupin superfamily protein
MFEYLIPVNARVPVAHSHEAFDETIYGLDGATIATLEGRKVLVERGDVLFIPRGSVHLIENRAAVDARGLSVITPVCSARNTFARWPMSSTREDRRMSNGSRPSCDATAYARFNDDVSGAPVPIRVVRGTQP